MWSLAQDSRSLLGALEDDVGKEAGQEHGLEQDEHLDLRAFLDQMSKTKRNPDGPRGILYPRFPNAICLVRVVQ